MSRGRNAASELWVSVQYTRLRRRAIDTLPSGVGYSVIVACNAISLRRLAFERDGLKLATLRAPRRDL